MTRSICIHPGDNVAVALADLPAGSEVEGPQSCLRLAESVSCAHKFALTSLEKGDQVIKYGHPIGHATQRIAAGEHVHSHNCRTNLEGLLQYRYAPKCVANPHRNEGRSFDGYLRADGQVGIRNEMWIIPTVGCINALADAMIADFTAEVGPLEGVDGVYAFKHPYGCSQLGDDLAHTRRILQDLVRHPNTGGVLVFGLGCESNVVADFRHSLGDHDPQRVKFLVAQESEDEIAQGVQLLRHIYQVARCDRRQSVPVSALRVGLKCGGSDGFSGLTANPLLGKFSDWLIAQGGCSVLTEVPEMFGAETLLMERCRDQGVFRKTVALVNDFKNYYLAHQQPVFENPSPGNKAGGITTLEEKSLGCVQKGGSETVVEVLGYGERIQGPSGLYLLSAPGNDGVSSTALAAAGCQLVLFTTGRGTPLGTFVPTVKVATNSGLAARKPRWIDFNAGALVEGSSFDALLRQLVDLVLAVANGQHVCNEKHHFRDMVIFKTGVTL